MQYYQQNPHDPQAARITVKTSKDVSISIIGACGLIPTPAPLGTTGSAGIGDMLVILSTRDNTLFCGIFGTIGIETQGVDTLVTTVAIARAVFYPHAPNHWNNSSCPHIHHIRHRRKSRYYWSAPLQPIAPDISYTIVYPFLRVVLNMWATTRG